MEGVVKFSPRVASHRVRGEGAGVRRGKQASPHPASHRTRGRGRRHTKQASPRSVS